MHDFQSVVTKLSKRKLSRSTVRGTKPYRRTLMIRGPNVSTKGRRWKFRSSLSPGDDLSMGLQAKLQIISFA